MSIKIMYHMFVYILVCVAPFCGAVKGEYFSERDGSFMNSITKSKPSEIPVLLDKRLGLFYQAQEDRDYGETGFIFFAMQEYKNKVARPIVADDIILFLSAMSSPQAIPAILAWEKDIYRNLNDPDRDKVYGFIEEYLDKDMPVRFQILGPFYALDSALSFERSKLSLERKDKGNTPDQIKLMNEREESIKKKIKRLVQYLEKNEDRIFDESNSNSESKGLYYNSYLRFLKSYSKEDFGLIDTYIKGLRRCCKSEKVAVDYRRDACCDLLGLGEEFSTLSVEYGRHFNTQNNRQFIHDLLKSEKNLQLQRDYLRYVEQAEKNATQSAPKNE